jgi:hypothetical protein
MNSSSSSSSDSDPVVGDRKASSVTSDFRAGFDQNVKKIFALQTLCDHVVEHDEFQTVMMVTMLGIAELLDIAKQEIAETSHSAIAIMCMSSDTSSSASSSSAFFTQICPKGLNESLSISSVSGGSILSHEDDDMEVDSVSDSGLKDMQIMSANFKEDFDDSSSSDSDINPFLPPVFTTMRASVLHRIKCIHPYSFDHDFETFSIQDIGNYEDLMRYSASILGLTMIELDNVFNAIFNLTAIRSSDWNCKTCLLKDFHD